MRDLDLSKTPMPDPDISQTDPAFAWQALAEADLDTLVAIAQRLHPSLPERTIVLAEKRRLFPDGCRRLTCSGAMRGYALSHPWTLASPPKLDRLLGALPERADCLFIHDVAVLPEARGQRAADAFLAQITAVAVARGLPALALIAAYGTHRLWRRFGFDDVAADALADDGRASLAGYGADVRYLSRRL